MGHHVFLSEMRKVIMRRDYYLTYEPVELTVLQTLYQVLSFVKGGV